MRIELNLQLEKPLKLPQQYNHIIQAVILKWLNDENYQKFIHDTGYEFNNRKFKMFTFSRLQGRFFIDKNERTITYEDNAKLLVSTADEKFLNYLINGLLLGEEITILNNKVNIRNINCYNKKLKTGSKIFTKSPITTYSTFENGLGKKTYYYSPFEKDFSELLRRNLINKYNAINGIEPINTDFNIKLVEDKKPKESTISYKSTIIKGWSGEFILEGSEELLDIAYNTGLGSKNAQGFGCIELCDN